MGTRLKLLTVGLVLVTAAMAGCSSTTAGSLGAVQDDASASASSSAASTSPAPSPDPVTPTAEPTGAGQPPTAPRDERILPMTLWSFQYAATGTTEARIPVG